MAALNFTLTITGPAHLEGRCDEAARFLQGRALRDLNEMAAYLASLHTAAEIARLYRRLFPDQWRASNGSSVLTAVTGAPAFAADGDSASAITAREQEFISLVDERLFPVYEDLWIEGERSWHIPIMPAGIDIEHVSSEPESFTDPVVILTALLWPGWFDGAAVEHARNLLGRQLAFREGAFLDGRAFRQACRRRGEPWSQLPDALLVVGHDTGNIFLDATPDDDLSGFTWDLRTVRALARWWAQAQVLLGRLENVIDWLQREPEQWNDILDLYSACLKTRKEFDDEERKRKKRTSLCADARRVSAQGGSAWLRRARCTARRAARSPAGRTWRHRWVFLAWKGTEQARRLRARRLRVQFPTAGRRPVLRRSIHSAGRDYGGGRQPETKRQRRFVCCGQRGCRRRIARRIARRF
jgi:hypothetical protein